MSIVGNLSDIQAVILAGGKGTRLQSVIADRPKVLAQINGRPFLDYQLAYLSSFGARRALLCTGYMGSLVRQTIGGSRHGVEIAYSQEDEPLDTAGAVRLALPCLSSDPVLVMNGDSFFRTDLAAFYRSHCDAGAQGSLLLTEVDNCERYGSVCLDEQGRVTSFREKSSVAGQGLISAGVYLLSIQMLQSIAPGRPVSIEREFFPQWIGRGLYGFVGQGVFIDIGTPETYELAGSFFADDR